MSARKAFSDFILAFEPPSDFVIASTLRYARLPKTYVRQEDPDIRYDWLLGEVFPRFLTFDTPPRRLGYAWGSHQPPRMPWFPSSG